MNKASDERGARLLRNAMQAHQAGRLAEAHELYRQVLARRPEDPDALHFFGVLLHNLGRSAEGIVSVQRSIRVATGNPHAWLNLGNMLLETDRTGEAKDAYERVTVLSPGLADAWYNLGVCLRRRDSAADAVVSLGHALSLRPDHAASHYQRGIALRESGDLTAAEADFRRALALRPDYLEVYESLAVLVYRQGRIDDATQVYEAWLEKDPGRSTAAHMAAAKKGERAPPRASDRYVADTFDRFAPTFDQNLARLGYRAPTLADVALARALPEGAVLDRVLDAGCGTGLCGALVRRRVRHLVGVDLSPAMIEAAARKGLYDELQVAELCSFMCARGPKFDAVICTDTLVYFGALEEAFVGAYLCLRPSGLLIFTLEKTLADDAGRHRLEPHGRYSHRPDYVRTALADAGFEVLALAEDVLRRERDEDVVGLVVTARSRTQDAGRPAV